MVGTLRDRYGRLPSWGRATILAMAALGAPILVFIVAVGWETSPGRMCGSGGSYSFLSPDGHLRAVLYEYDCGATTDFGTHIAILPASRMFDPFSVNESQRVFVANGNHGAASVDELGILPITVIWIDSQHLQVLAPREARVFLQKTEVGGIAIQYLFRG